MTLHFKAEGNIEYTGLLYIPEKAPYDLFQPDKKNSLKLYINKVFISDKIESLMPHYLRFVKGIVDSADLPLNISREILQYSPLMEKIKTGMVKRLLKELQKRFPGIPFFCTGDYNSSTDSQEFGNLLKSTGFKDAALAAERAENTAFYSAFHPDERKIRSDKANIDHVVFYGDVKALSAKMLVGEILFKASDHFPIVVDFKI
jgi:HSP90 family molecular chaperone